MNEKRTLPISFQRPLQDRNALLWVCQRYELLPGEIPHPLDLPEAQAILRYRTQMDDADKALASLFWEAVWLEGAQSQILEGLRQVTESQPAQSRRSLVVLASEADAHAQISSQQFLSVCVLPGLLDQNIPPDGRYGTLRARQRERVAWALSERIGTFSGRALVVVGASEEKDLEELYKTLEDIPFIDLHVLIVWPENQLHPH